MSDDPLQERPIPLEGEVEAVDDAEEPEQPYDVRESGLRMLCGGLALVAGCAFLQMLIEHAWAVRLLLFALGGWVLSLEGARRLVTAKRSVDLSPGLGCVTVIATFVGACALTWLMLIAIVLFEHR